jgi:hypothetical protein
MAFASEADIFNGWAAIGGTYKKFDQGKQLGQRATTVVSLGTDQQGNQRTKDVKGGICRALSLRFIECRLTGMADLDELQTTLEGTFDVTMVQQGAYSLGLKDEKTAGGVKAQSPGATI